MYSSVGDRLKNFKVLVGNEFNIKSTKAAAIGSWSECGHVTGKLLF